VGQRELFVLEARDLLGAGVAREQRGRGDPREGGREAHTGVLAHPGGGGRGGGVRRWSPNAELGASAVRQPPVRRKNTSSRGGTRTRDRVINSHLLYHLSYSGIDLKITSVAGQGSRVA